MSKYFALLTRLGADRLANAAALGTKIEITHMAVGDGGGTLPTPDTMQTALVNEKRRAAINVLSVDPKNTNQIIAEQVIPESEGGWWIREIGLFDKDGVLIAVGNCAETYKPQLQEGSGRTQTIRMVLIVSHTNAVTLKIDPSVVLATREYADAVVAKAISEHEQSRRHPDATLNEKGFVMLSSVVDSDSEQRAATSKAVKMAYDNAARRLDKHRNGADIPDTAAFVKHLGLGNTVRNAERLVGLPNETRLASGDKDIYLYVTDDMRTGAYHKLNGQVWSFNQKGTMEDGLIPIKCGGTGAKTAAEALAALGGVPDHRSVNGKTLTTDIQLTANDVNAYAKQQNGADILDKSAFVKNLGLGDTVRNAERLVGLPNETRLTSGDKDLYLYVTDDMQAGAYHKLRGHIWSFNQKGTMENGLIPIKCGGTGATTATEALAALGGVPGHRSVNGKTLTADIQLTANDVNAYAKQQNGADILNTTAFVKNLGLAETKRLAENALLGIGQRWRDVTQQRKVGIDYTNETGRPIMVNFTGLAAVAESAAYNIIGYVDGVKAILEVGPMLKGSTRSISFIVPPGSTYSCAAYSDVKSGFVSWVELR
ncbi:phage tail protein [Xenorhabdus stockiae]|uniref:phage tail protein n=1 Tax=Xenorhabdus stockiae TaxID=351614 RepID=UPI003CF1BB8D